MRVWKYGVPIRSEPFVFSMPIGAVPLAVRMQNGEPRLWVKVEPRPPYVERRFRWVGTGDDFDQEATIDYVGTVLTADERFVWHLFEIH